MIATGIERSVRDFVNAAAAELGMTLHWNGKGVEETAVVADPGPQSNVRKGQVIVRIDPRYFRPTDIDSMVGDAAKACEKLGWQPKVSFEELVREMVRCDLEAAARDQMYHQHQHDCALHNLHY